VPLGIPFASDRSMTTISTPGRSTRHHPAEHLVDQYLEMPGLSLTVPQAARLFGLEADVCAQQLDSLVQTGFLQKTLRGRYVRPTSV
jgi:hypothetical protein